MQLDVLVECIDEANRFLERANELMRVVDNPDAGPKLIDEEGWVLSNQNSRSIRRSSLDLSDALRRLRRSKGQ